MSIFKAENYNAFFNQAKWKTNVLSSDKFIQKSSNLSFESAGSIGVSDNQFILLQLSDGDQRVINTSQVVPTLKGNSDKPDINMLLDFEGVKISSNEDIDKDSKATLQLEVGQEEKLFYCINGGMDLFNEIQGKKTDSKAFKKSTDQALGNKPISLPGGIGQISLRVLKHKEPKWWQKVFSFAKSDPAKEYFSYKVPVNY